jgi:hypothetical protein
MAGGYFWFAFVEGFLFVIIVLLAKDNTFPQSKAAETRSKTFIQSEPRH